MCTQDSFHDAVNILKFLQNHTGWRDATDSKSRDVSVAESQKAVTETKQNFYFEAKITSVLCNINLEI